MPLPEDNFEKVGPTVYLIPPESQINAVGNIRVSNGATSLVVTFKEGHPVVCASFEDKHCDLCKELGYKQKVGCER